MQPMRIIIMGAAGRDFHVFNTYFRERADYQVVAFTATQIPHIANRHYPAVLAGPHYPAGIPIYPEEELAILVRQHNIDQVVFAYSDISHQQLMHKASAILAAGADFRLLGPRHTMLTAAKPVVAVCAVRTGVGKSQTTRAVCAALAAAGKRPVIVRHPMPYGDLLAQRCQRFANYDDLDRHHCTIEEREEYEPHLTAGHVVYAGVDYASILRQAEAEADIIVWDGGNNDFPFFKPDLLLVLADPHRPGHELQYHPGETSLRMADIIIVNKVDTAQSDDIAVVLDNARRLNAKAQIIEAASPLIVSEPERISGKRVLVVEDGPSLTHGDMPYGAGMVAAWRFGAHSIVDARQIAVGSLQQTYQQYPHLDQVLPAMGYHPQQIADLAATIEQADCDLVLAATPVDLSRLFPISKPLLHVKYRLELRDHTLEELLAPLLQS